MLSVYLLVMGLLLGYLADALAAAEKTEDLILAIGETGVGGLVRTVSVAQHVDQLLGGGGAHVPAPLGEPLDRDDQLLRSRTLADVPGCTRA